MWKSWVLSLERKREKVMDDVSGDNGKGELVYVKCEECERECLECG